MKREWVTKRVRAYNLKPGDVIEFLDRRNLKTVKRTVAAIEDERIDDTDHAVIKFRRCRWGLVAKRTELIRVRRLTASKPRSKP